MGITHYKSSPLSVIHAFTVWGVECRVQFPMVPAGGVSLLGGSFLHVSCVYGFHQFRDM
ncbi:hypothetical protein STHERM_c12150 [Spirochaeta thermophila DSM 6192]|uniref:Uncharacterized protein n=1 Tax=Winmispira thermophila (strain ATCC 49972 / DSM 6192 / RI 19.B1) TaxID=665571 RepID=E0RT19_WINT6|nr:hypothetical protein STHERM_c12150 [Spirochaeta thermophila DSM 6192]